MAMNEVVHAVQHQVDHKLEHDEHGEHDHGGGHHDDGKASKDNNKRIALLISVIALCLAFSETLGKSAQTAALSYNVEASNFWAFYQAKTIRQTSLQAANEILKLERLKTTAESPEAVKTALAQRIDLWDKTVARYESEPRERELRKDINRSPPYGEGRRELMGLALASESRRDTALERYHSYEIASAAYQIGIVMASAAVLTGMMILAYAAAGLGVVGLMFTWFGLISPTVPHDVVHWIEHFFVATGGH
jgi:hypothetical protein